MERILSFSAAAKTICFMRLFVPAVTKLDIFGFFIGTFNVTGGGIPEHQVGIDVLTLNQLQRNERLDVFNVRADGIQGPTQRVVV